MEEIGIIFTSLTTKHSVLHSKMLLNVLLSPIVVNGMEQHVMELQSKVNYVLQITMILFTFVNLYQPNQIVYLLKDVLILITSKVLKCVILPSITTMPPEVSSLLIC